MLANKAGNIFILISGKDARLQSQRFLGGVSQIFKLPGVRSQTLQILGSRIWIFFKKWSWSESWNQIILPTNSATLQSRSQESGIFDGIGVTFLETDLTNFRESELDHLPSNSATLDL